MKQGVPRFLTIFVTLLALAGFAWGGFACVGPVWAADASQDNTQDNAPDNVSDNAPDNASDNGSDNGQDVGPDAESEGDAHFHVPDAPVPEGVSVEEPSTIAVMGHDVVPKKGILEVTTDMNVRAGPGTNFDRVDGLKGGDRVRLVGLTPDGTWAAVNKDGVTLGYVFAKLLVPVVDGALKEQFFGSFMSDKQGDGVACDYRFRFERKSDVEGANFQTADYEIRFRCANSKGAALFYGQMFLTEGPVDEVKDLHLINLDVRSIGDGMEEFLSTTYLYNPKTGKMTFDGHTMPQYALPPKVQTFKTTSVKDALKQALEASMGCWTEEAWTSLFSKKQ